MEKIGIKSQIGSRLSPVLLGTLLFVIIVISFLLPLSLDKENGKDWY